MVVRSVIGMARNILTVSRQLHKGGFIKNVNNRVNVSYLSSNIVPNTSDTFFSRCYATKPKKEPKGKKVKPKVLLSHEEMEQVIDVNSLLESMKKAVENLKFDYVKQLSLRTTPGAIENLPVKFDGNEYSLNQIAQLAKKNPQLFVINVSSTPQAVKNVLEAIQQSGMNLNPQQDGTTIFVTLPKITKEHREVLARNAKAMFNNTKISIQDIQNRFIKAAKKQKETLSEDLVFNTQQQISVIADEHIAEAEKLMKSKQTELLGNN